MAVGIEWFPLETNLLTDDEKIFGLMDGGLDTQAFADFGRFVALLTRIYRDGPAMQVDRRKLRRMAHDLGLSVAELTDFIARCVDSGLFHAGLWEQHLVLTSRGIQRRWANAKTKATKRPTTLPDEMAQWSLLDGEPPALKAQVATFAQFCGNCAADCADTAPTAAMCGEGAAECRKQEGSAQDVPPDKIRLDKKRLEEKREELEGDVAGTGEVFDNQPSQSLESSEVLNNSKPSEQNRDVSELVPPCMAREYGSRVCLDDQGAPHRTPYGALEARYHNVTGRTDFAAFMAKVADLCPGGCRASPIEVGECYQLVSAAIDKTDPTKGTPWAIVRHVLTSDRGPRHG